MFENKKLEKLMGSFGALLHDNPFKVILFVLLCSLLPILNIGKIQVDTSTEGFYHPNDPALLIYENYKKQFGRDEQIVLAIKNKNLFSLDFLNKLKTIHEEIEKNVPNIEKVKSLYNVRNTKGTEEALSTKELLVNMPKNREELELIKKDAINSHLYKNLYLSSDREMTTIMIKLSTYKSSKKESASLENYLSEFEEDTEDLSQREFLTAKEIDESLKKLYLIVDKYKKDGLDIYLAGTPIILDALKSQMRNDMKLFMKIDFLIIIVLLFIIFKRVSAVLYPLLIIGLSLLFTIGIMGLTGVNFKLPTQIIPSLLITVSVSASVHILSLFFDKFNNISNRREAIIYAFEHSGVPIIMTSITTAIGIGAFFNSKVSPISDLGFFAFLGVLVSLCLTLILLPVLLSITPLKPKKRVRLSFFNLLMKKLASFNVRYYKSIVIFSTVLVFFSLFISSKIVLSHNPLNWFQANNEHRISTQVIDEKMHGSTTIEVIVDTRLPNGWKDKKRLEALNQLSKKLETYVDKYLYIGKVISIATILKESNRALHENKEKYYTIPKNSNLISQELLLFESSGSDDLKDFVDTQFTKTHITIMLPWTDSMKSVDVIKYIQTEFEKSFPKDTILITGMKPLLVETFSQAINSSVISYITSFILITFVMIIILGSIRIGLLSMIPNLVPIILGLFLMYRFHIPLDMFTLLIGSIAIGLAVDDTIHFFHNFKRMYLETEDIEKAIEETFLTTGKAMSITTIILAMGFYMYLFADMVAVQNFGFLTGSVIILALFSDIFLAPALMIIAVKFNWIKENK